jgi:hypothetical protein
MPAAGIPYIFLMIKYNFKEFIKRRKNIFGILFGKISTQRLFFAVGDTPAERRLRQH